MVHAHRKWLVACSTFYVILDVVGVAVLPAIGVTGRERSLLQIGLLIAAVAAFLLLAIRVAVTAERHVISSTVAVSCVAILGAALVVIHLGYTVLPRQFWWDTEPIGVLGSGIYDLAIRLVFAAPTAALIGALGYGLRRARAVQR